MTQQTHKQFTGELTVENWQEENHGEFSLAKVQMALTGELTATLTGHYQLAYVAPNEHALYTGLLMLTTNINNENGSVVLRDSGEFKNGVSNSVWQVLTDTATGCLAGVSGQGKLCSTHLVKSVFELELVFAS